MPSSQGKVKRGHCSLYTGVFEDCNSPPLALSVARKAVRIWVTALLCDVTSRCPLPPPKTSDSIYWGEAAAGEQRTVSPLRSLPWLRQHRRQGGEQASSAQAQSWKGCGLWLGPCTPAWSDWGDSADPARWVWVTQRGQGTYCGVGQHVVWCVSFRGWDLKAMGAHSMLGISWFTVAHQRGGAVNLLASSNIPSPK